jgi:hypothetical protein
MEIFRGVGLQEEIESASAREFVQNGAIVSVESLASPEIKFFFPHFNEGVEALSPASRLFITQIGLEPLLRRSAQPISWTARRSSRRSATSISKGGSSGW